MIMDIIVFAILIATIFFSMRRGFALTLANFFGGIISVVIGWIFSDDLAEVLFEETFVGTWLTDKLHDGLVQSWQNSEIYQALPALLREKSNSGTSWTDSDLITTGSEKLVMFFLTVISFCGLSSKMCKFWKKILGRETYPVLYQNTFYG